MVDDRLWSLLAIRLVGVVNRLLAAFVLGGNDLDNLDIPLAVSSFFGIFLPGRGVLLSRLVTRRSSHILHLDVLHGSENEGLLAEDKAAIECLDQEADDLHAVGNLNLDTLSTFAVHD